jgi:hypothetical protein
MKFTNTLVVAAFALSTMTAFAQDKKASSTQPKPAQTKSAQPKPAQAKSPDAKAADASAATPDQAAAGEKAWMEYSTPSEVHKMMGNDEGHWHEECTFWMAPGAPEQKAESESENKMILGGRYLESVHTGSMMGMPFEGRGLLGYDNKLKQFQSTWVDNMGTGVMYLAGKYDEKTRTTSMTGTMVDPMSGKIEKVRQTFQWVDESTRLLTMYVNRDGKEFKTMEIKMTRK